MSNSAAPQHMSLVYTAPDGRRIYVGDAYSANLGKQLEDYGVVGVLNVAYDLDDQPVFTEPPQSMSPDPHRSAPEPSATSAGVHVGYLSKKVQYAKAGLIDGTHNPTGIMGLAAAVYMADQLWRFPVADLPCPPLVNIYPTDGHLLIHCWSGQSRSVSVAALFIWYKWGAAGLDSNLKSFQATYTMVKQARRDSTEPWKSGPCCLPDEGNYTQEPPTVGMQEAALHLSQSYGQLFPAPRSKFFRAIRRSLAPLRP